MCILSSEMPQKRLRGRLRAAIKNSAPAPGPMEGSTSHLNGRDEVCAFVTTVAEGVTSF